MTHPFFSLLLLVVLCLSACEKDSLTPSTLNLRLTIQNPFGEPVIGAEVKLLPGGLDATTDDRGVAEFTDLTPLTYDVAVNHFDYATQRFQIEVRQGPVVAAAVRMEMNENQPTVSIYEPHIDYTKQILLGHPLRMNMHAFNGADTELSYTVSSDRAGTLATGVFRERRAAPQVYGLSLGMHQMTVTVTAPTGHQRGIPFTVEVLAPVQTPKLRIDTLEGNAVQLTWSGTDSPFLSHYTLYHATDDTTNFVYLSDHSEAGDTTYRHLDPLFGYDHHYRVVMHLNSDTSLSSNIATYEAGVEFIDAGANIRAMRLDDRAGKLYMMTDQLNGITVYRAADLKVLTTIDLPEQAFTMTLNEAKNELYVPLPQRGTIAVFDLSTHSLKRSVPTYGPLTGSAIAHPSDVVVLAEGLIAYTGYGAIDRNVVIADAVTGDTVQSFKLNFYRPILLAAPDGRRLFAFAGNNLRRYALSATGAALEQSIYLGSANYSTAFITDDGSRVVFGHSMHDAHDLTRIYGTYDSRLAALSGDGQLAAGGDHVMNGETFASFQDLPSHLRFAAIDTEHRELYFVLQSDAERMYRLPIITP